MKDEKIILNDEELKNVNGGNFLDFIKNIFNKKEDTLEVNAGLTRPNGGGSGITKPSIKNN